MGTGERALTCVVRQSRIDDCYFEIFHSYQLYIEANSNPVVNLVMASNRSTTANIPYTVEVLTTT